MKKVVLILSSIFIVLSIILGYILLTNNKVEIILQGNENIKLNVFEQYNDEGITLKNNNKIIDKKDYILNITNNLDTNKLGNYIIDYDITYKRKNYNIKRYIEVIDKVSPILNINLEEVEKDYCTNKLIKELEYNAIDNYDGDITNNIEYIENEDKIILKVKDSSNNEIVKEIKIKYTDKPNNKFTLIGNKTIYIEQNNTYNDAGVKYTDGCGNKIDKEIKVSGNIDTKTIGEYKIKYEVDGKTLSRTIIVYEKGKNPNPNNKIIYLTFDDGPGYYTKKILNTLDKYNVKATFFVTHQFPSYISLIKDEYEKGHTIGVHTYTHKYDVYTSLETYLDDFNKMNEVVKEYTGSYTKLFRFPGGSSNTVSKSYKKGIVTEIANRMTEDGYVYFDWNVSSGDASGAGSTKIYNNVTKGIKNCTKCVVLMHDIKSTTANALDDILNTLTKEGYEFDTLDENSPTAHHSINN